MPYSQNTKRIWREKKIKFHKTPTGGGHRFTKLFRKIEFFSNDGFPYSPMQTDTLMSGRSTPIPEHFVLIRSLQFLKYMFKTKVFWAPLTHFSEQSLLCLFPVLYYRRSAFQCERDFIGTSSEKNDITWEFFPRGQTPPPP